MIKLDCVNVSWMRISLRYDEFSDELNDLFRQEQLKKFSVSYYRLSVK